MTPTNPPPPDPPVTRAEVDEALDLLDLLEPGRSEPIDPEHVRRVRATVERLAKGGGVGA
jgi:hypothetical protein